MKNVLKKKIESLRKERDELSLAVCSQQAHIDVAYHKLEEKNVELANLQNDILKLQNQIDKLNSAPYLLEHYESVVRKITGKGLGNNTTPPPLGGHIVAAPRDIDLSCLDNVIEQGKTGTNETVSSDTNSGMNSVSHRKDGVVTVIKEWEEKVAKPRVTNRDNCIMSDPDEEETECSELS